MYPKHVGHENGGCGHLGRAPLSRPTFGGHSCKKDSMVAPHESVLNYRQTQTHQQTHQHPHTQEDPKTHTHTHTSTHDPPPTHAQTSRM